MKPERWVQIEELFHRATECDAEERAAFLEEACRGDLELRRQVEALLACEASAEDHVQAAVRSELSGFGFPLVGQTVSHYRILNGLGGGGMGLVYRAGDLKLGRQVALKFLPEESATEPAALARFEREARSASALEHPNICPIYEFGEHEGQPFLVMQLLEGQTLRELICAAGPGKPAFALDKLLDLAVQITAGLEAAHRHGIIHRDIKPANIFVTTQGQAKILDFGLAKLAHPSLDDVYESERKVSSPNPGGIRRNAASAPTPDPFLSRTGVAIGTAGYMSPEQARGEKLDARTDAFSFGLVLYELSTGDRAFEGDTGPELHQAVLTQMVVPVRQRHPEIPIKLERIISKTLEKDRDARYQTISELREDLEKFKREIEPRNRPAWWARWVLLASFLCTLVLAGIFISEKLRSRLPIPKVVNSAQITRDGLPKPKFPLFKLVSDGSALYFREGSVDDTEQNAAIVQVSAHGGEMARIPLSLRSPIAFDFSQNRSELLLGTEFESTNADRPLWVLPLPAGPPHRLGNIIADDACWAPDGRHLAFANGKDVFVADADGSKVRKLASADGFDYLGWIRFSPDGTRLRFTAGGRNVPGDEAMEMAADGSGLHRLPIHGGCCGTWSPDGRYYFYENDLDIWVLPERKSVFGKVELGIPIQLTAGPVKFGSPLPSTDGKYLFVAGYQLQPLIKLVHYNPRSHQFTPFLGGISAGELEVSPDGQWVTYTTFPESNLWRSKLDGSQRLQLTSAPINAHAPRWSPDGKQILFTDSADKLLVVPAYGGPPHQLMPADRHNLVGAGAWLPDGNSIVFAGRMGCFENSCLAIYRLDLRTQHVSKVPGSDGMLAAGLSHDGHYLTALLPMPQDQNTVMLYDLQTQRWSELAKGFASNVWSHDNQFVYLLRKQEAKPAELTRIRVPDGKVQRVLDLKGVTLGDDWISLLPDDSPLLMLDRSRKIEEIYRLELQYQ